MKLIKVGYQICLLPYLIGCIDPNQALQGEVESKPQSMAATALDELDADPRINQKLVEASYEFFLQANSGISLCSGMIAASLDSTYNLSFDGASATCGEVNFDISKILRPINLKNLIGKTTFNQDNATQSDLNLSHDGKILFLEGIGERLRFDPPRPILFGPLILDQDIYQGFSQKWNTVVSINEKDFKGQAAGSYQASVVETHSVYSDASAELGNQFNDVIHWQIISKGFEDLPDRYGLLLPQFDLWFSSNPLMIPRVKAVIQTKRLFSEFIDGAPPSEDQIVEDFGELVGNITIDLQLRSFNMLSDQAL